MAQLPCEPNDVIFRSIPSTKSIDSRILNVYYYRQTDRLCFVLRQRRHGAPAADAAAVAAAAEACDGMGGAGFSTLRVGGGLCLCTFILYYYYTV